MGPVHASTIIDAPREEVYELLLDVSTRPGIYKGFTGQFNLLQPQTRGAHAGVRFRFDVPMHEMWLETVIDRVEPPYLIEERCRLGRMNRIYGRLLWELVEVGENMTEARVMFLTEPTFWWDKVREKLQPGLNGWLRRRFQGSLEALRDAVEAGTTDELERVRMAGGGRHAFGVA